MISIELDLNYLSRYINIDAQRLQAYGSQSLQEIVETEAANGNTAAEDYLISILKDPNAIMRLFKLGSAKNRWKILREMNPDDLSRLLQYLPAKDLANGLQFFTQDALMKYIREMPKKEITKILFECYSKQDFLKLVPESDLNKWFESEKVDPKKLMKEVQSLNKEALMQMVEGVTGKPVDENTDRKGLLETIEQLNPKQFTESIQALKPKYKRQIIMNMCEEDPKLWEEFSVKTLTKPLELLDKSELIKGMGKLDEDMLIKVIDNLPQDLMAVVVTQIDPEVFAQLLSTDFADLLKNVVSA